MPMRIEYEGTINNGRSHVEDHDNFVGRLSANPVEGPYYRGTSDPVGDTYTETNKGPALLTGKSVLRCHVAPHKAFP